MSYDNNGNLTNDGVYMFEYDAWNRLRRTILTDGSDETTIGEHEYYADNRRSQKTVSNRGEEVVENDGGDTSVLYYYDKQWRILETRNGSNQTTFQHLWGTRYTDELIWIEKNGDPTESNDTNPDEQSGESTADQRYFVHQDRNWNVVALSEYDTSGTNNGRIVERYSYTPYGSFIVLKGDSGSGELNAVGLTSTIGNPFAHQGLPFDCEKDSYQNRWRECTTALQRFVQPDPAARSVFSAYLGIQGWTPYIYLRNSPTTVRDPYGLYDTCPLGSPPPPPNDSCPCGSAFGPTDPVDPPGETGPVCDGHGNCVVNIASPQSDFPQPILDCVIQHECQHCEDLTEHNPTACCIFDENEAPMPMEGDEYWNSECSATRSSLNCLGYGACGLPMSDGYEECEKVRKCEYCKKQCEEKYYCFHQNPDTLQDCYANNCDRPGQPCGGPSSLPPAFDIGFGLE